jgi:hypothetical protein
MGVALAAAIACGATDSVAQAAAYPAMAPVDQYLMDRDAEIRLARSAAPESISRDATVLVLGRQGYEVAAPGRNGFTCMVARGWMAGFDWPEFWNPKIRAADCMNPQAARSIVPVMLLRGRMIMAGRSRAEILSALRAGFASGELPKLEAGAMDYMMSKASYLTDQGEHNAPHLMFFTVGMDAGDWGSDMAGSPIMSAPYWFFEPEPTGMRGLPPMVVSLVAVPNWSDGTPAGSHRQ